MMRDDPIARVLRIARSSPDRRQWARARPPFLWSELGYVVDLALTGMRVCGRGSDAELCPGRELEVALGRTRGEVRVKARIAWVDWSRQHAGPHLFEAGLEFLSIDDRQAGVIESLMGEGGRAAGATKARG